MSQEVTPFSLKDAPALIERLLPVQKLSAEAYKEQMGGKGKTLTGLGNFWKGRKPLILSKACILGCLLPATDNPARDLAIFEKLMAMDDESLVVRQKRRAKPKVILAKLSIARIADYFVVEPEGALPVAAPVDWSKLENDQVKVAWRQDISELERRQLEAQMLAKVSYRERVDEAIRPEEVMDTVHNHIWNAVNAHLGTGAQTFPELVEQLGIMRYGHRPRVSDTFCGSGQIPFEAARLGCDVYASDLNPVACMLTWGAFHIVGGSEKSRDKMLKDQRELIHRVQLEVDRMGVETDAHGWRAKAFLYCLEVRCPQTGWMVPLLPSRVVSMGYRVAAELVPDLSKRRYDIKIRTGVSEIEMEAASVGTLGREGKFGEAYLMHQLDGVNYKTKISTLRGDYTKPDGTIGNRLRMWEKLDFMPRPDDLLQERLFCVEWMRLRSKGKGEEYDFRSVSEDDLRRERIVQSYVADHLPDWQSKGWVPDMRIEVGGPPRYQGLDLIRARGWTHWHHLFNPRQLLAAALYNGQGGAESKFGLTQILNFSSRLSPWATAKARIAKDGSGKHIGGASDNVANTFYNQALNTLFMYGCRATASALPLAEPDLKSYPLAPNLGLDISCAPVHDSKNPADIFITDPPYGDAVKYEEILDFFVAWLRKNPPPEFAGWIWDSRRSLAIKGEGEDFRRGMVAAYKRMTECMPENGIQVIMFTHQSGTIWADTANIVWASGLQVTAAWYVVTETDSVMREGSYVKGTVLLICRKRCGTRKTTRDDLAWEIQEEVETQVHTLTGLNQEAKGLYRDENVFEDADIQMAGYAAALRVLTRYEVIDGRDMSNEAIRPRVKGETTFVDGLIAFAVDTANQCLVPEGISKTHWDKLTGAERFYLKMLDMETRGAKTLDNYQNFAKAFKVRDFKPLLASQKANDAKLKSAAEFGRTEMGEGSELHQSVLRAVLYALMELVKNVDGSEVLAHLILNIPDYYGNMTQRELAIDLTDYLSKRLASLRPDEASAARVLRELVKHQRLG
jgi:putative DNA methylase